jgi:hypothetical protein
MSNSFLQLIKCKCYDDSFSWSAPGMDHDIGSPTAHLGTQIPIHKCQWNGYWTSVTLLKRIELQDAFKCGISNLNTRPQCVPTSQWITPGWPWMQEIRIEIRSCTWKGVLQYQEWDIVTMLSYLADISIFQWKWPAAEKPNSTDSTHPPHALVSQVLKALQ